MQNQPVALLTGANKGAALQIAKDLAINHSPSRPNSALRLY
jgi:hypothetical protein